MEHNVIYGKNTVLEALKTIPKRINKILISKNIHNDKKIDTILDLAKENNVLFQFIPKEKLQKYAEFNHQGVVANVSSVEYKDLYSFLDADKKKDSKILILDGIEDPHNFGAIIRTCVCAGFDAIVISKRKNVQITPVVEKTSAGAINHIPIISVNSLSGLIETLKKNNYWIIASDAKGKDNYFDVDYTDTKIAIVMGSEGNGVSKTILNQADYTIKIPMYNNFNSLNVSNATAIIIYEVMKQTIQKSKNIV